ADPPRHIFAWGGTLPGMRASAAIVGSRAATPYGLAIADRLARDLAAHGVCVVSGLARGIDSAAHEGALAAGGRTPAGSRPAGGRTVAVIASALDRLGGSQAELAGRIVERGAILSEVGSGGPFGRGAFVKRNRLIAACSRVTVVVEAAEDGGGLTTAAVARTL